MGVGFSKERERKKLGKDVKEWRIQNLGEEQGVANLCLCATGVCEKGEERVEEDSKLRVLVFRKLSLPYFDCQ